MDFERSQLEVMSIPLIRKKRLTANMPNESWPCEAKLRGSGDGVPDNGYEWEKITNNASASLMAFKLLSFTSTLFSRRVVICTRDRNISIYPDGRFQTSLMVILTLIFSLMPKV